MVAADQTTRRHATKFQMIRISAFILGSRFAYIITFVFNNAVLQTRGVSEFLMTISWGIAGPLGLIFIPLLGKWSDTCKCSWGRRRPFIIATAILLVFSLALVAFGDDFGNAFGLRGSNVNQTKLFGNLSESDSSSASAKQRNKRYDLSRTKRMAEGGKVWVDHAVHHSLVGIVLTFIGSIILYVSLKLSWSPSRAYIADVSTPETNTAAMSIYTIMGCIGSFLGGIFGGIQWKKIGILKFMDYEFTFIYSVTLVIVIISAVICVTAFKETPFKPKGNILENPNSDYKTFAADKEKNLMRKCSMDSVEIASKDLVFADSEAANEETFSIKRYCASLICMPRFLFLLYICTLFGICWYSFYYIYLTDYIGKVIYKGDPSKPPHSQLHNLYVAGVRQGSFCMAIDAAAAAIHAFISIELVRRFGVKPLYVGGQALGTVVMVLMSIVRLPAAIYILSIFSGIQYSTVMTFPYLLLVRYHEADVFSEKESKSCTKRGLGTDLAIFTSAYSLSQIIGAMLVSLLLAIFGTIAVSMWCAAGSALFGTVIAIFLRYDTDRKVDEEAEQGEGKDGSGGEE